MTSPDWECERETTCLMCRDIKDRKETKINIIEILNEIISNRHMTNLIIHYFDNLPVYFHELRTITVKIKTFTHYIMFYQNYFKGYDGTLQYYGNRVKYDKPTKLYHYWGIVN